MSAITNHHPQHHQDTPQLLKDRLTASQNTVRTSWGCAQRDLVALVSGTLADLEKTIHTIKNDKLGEDARLVQLDECADTLTRLLTQGREQTQTALNTLGARRGELLLARARVVDEHRVHLTEIRRDNSKSSSSSSSGSAADALRDEIGGRLRARLEKIDALEARAISNLKRKYLTMQMNGDEDDDDDDELSP